jgi:phosphonate transport system ATP-binding protein
MVGAIMLCVKEVWYKYKNEKEYTLKGISFKMGEGEIVGLLGSSGAGKTTLLKCIANLLPPTFGSVIIDDASCLFNNNLTGIIFQERGVLDSLTVLENVLLGCLGRTQVLFSIFGIYPKKEILVGLDCLEKVGLSGYSQTRASKLSSGQKQRVSIARVLCQGPKIVLADEPVSNLDPDLSDQILDMLVNVCVENRFLLIMSLHSPQLAQKYCNRVLGLKQGRILYDDVPSELPNIVPNLYRKIEQI